MMSASTYIYPLSLPDALPISRPRRALGGGAALAGRPHRRRRVAGDGHAGPPPLRPHGHGERGAPRSEEHTSELQSHSDLVCRLLLEKKKNIIARCRDTRDDDR